MGKYKMIWLKLWLNHVYCVFDLSTEQSIWNVRFDLDLIWTYRDLI